MKRFLTYLPLIVALLVPTLLIAEDRVSVPAVQQSGAEYVNANLFDTICEGTPNYTRNGFNLRTDTLAARSSDYVFFRVSAGNDSVYYLWLAVLPSYHTYDTLSVCQNMLPLRYGSRWFPATTLTGDYGVSFLSQSSCDSLVSLHLTVDTMMLRDTIVITCHSFTWDRTDRTYSTPGYSQPDNYMLMGRNGTCDTLLRLGLLIYDTVRAHIDTQVCDSYVFGGNTYSVSRTHVARVGTSSFHGCDSVVYYSFHVLPSTHGDFYVEAFDDTYVWPDSIGGSGATFHISGLTNRVTTGTNGCDSVTTLHLELHGMPVWCTNQVFDNDEYNGFPIPSPHTAGTYGIYLRDGLTASDGVSDSIVLLRYRFVQHYYFMHMDTICSNDTVLFHGVTLVHPGEIGGDFRDTVMYRTTEGCDSGYVAMLRVYPTYVDTVVEYLCRRPADYHRGDSAAFYVDSLHIVAAQCDSVVYRDQMHFVPDTVIYHREACVSYTWEATDGSYSSVITYTNNGTTAHSASAPHRRMRQHRCA